MIEEKEIIELGWVNKDNTYYRGGWILYFSYQEKKWILAKNMCYGHKRMFVGKLTKIKLNYLINKFNILPYLPDPYL